MREAKLKIPKKYKKFNKMSVSELAEFIKIAYNFTLIYDAKEKKYWVYGLEPCGAGKISCEDAAMLVYWLDLTQKR